MTGFAAGAATVRVIVTPQHLSESSFATPIHTTGLWLELPYRTVFFFGNPVTCGLAAVFSNCDHLCYETKKAFDVAWVTWQMYTFFIKCRYTLAVNFWSMIWGLLLFIS